MWFLDGRKEEEGEKDDSWANSIRLWLKKKLGRKVVGGKSKTLV